MLGDRAEAEDVAQDALMRLWRVSGRWEAGRARVTTWLYRVVANLCIDRMRRGQPVAGPETGDTVAEPAPGAEARMQLAARRQALHRALRQLPERQRQAVVLRHIEGLANPEIASLMEISVEAVESLTARGKRGLEAALEGRRSELGIEDGTD